MAAVLKKRALAEYSQVINEEQPRPPKKLRLVKKSKPLPWKLEVSSLFRAATGQEALNFLMQMAESMPSQAEDAATAYKALSDHLPKEKDSVVRAKLIQLLGNLCRIAKVDPLSFIDEMAVYVRDCDETSHKVILQLLNTMHKLSNELSTTSSEGVKFQQRLFQLARQNLGDSYYLVKCKCLEIVSDVQPGDSTGATTLKLLGDFCRCQDPRVRTVAFQSVLKMCDKGQKVDLGLYTDVTQALDDDYEGVRIAALKIIVVIGRTFADSLVDVSESREQIRLIDDAFAKVCNAINDLSLPVRTQAALLLGTMTNVSSRFLEQTLDKRLMSNMRKKRSAHERQKESYQTGEWASGQKWSDDAPREALDAESVQLITTGACGAFVHGLEDEFLEVRSASIDSLCQLALQSHPFAILSIDFLVDMFNDEIEEVRLKAVHSLTKISNHIVLREDQLETILAVLEDFATDIREAVHCMLSVCHLSTKTCLKMCVDHLLENLKRYPHDKRSIWNCLQKLGKCHPELLLPLVTELLCIHPFFDTPEPDMDDPAYVSILILVFNAASSCPTMIPLLEQHTVKHYSYLRDSLPHLVPPIKYLQPQCQNRREITEVKTNTVAFLQEVLEKIARAEKLNAQTRQRLQETAIQDLHRLAEIEPTLEASANCASLYIQCQLLFAKILQNKNWCSSSMLALQRGNTVKNAVEQLLQASFRLNHMYVGLSTAEVATVKQMRLKVFALQLVYIVRGSNSSALALCDHFLGQVEHVQKFLYENGTCPDSFVSCVFHEMGQLTDPKPGTVARLLQPLLQSYHSPALRVTSPVRQAKATVYEPTGDSDTPLRFTAGLLLGVHMDAELENVDDLSAVRIKVKYPDQQCQLILPKESDFKETDKWKHRLNTTILLSHNVWSEACQVEITLTLDFQELGPGCGGGGIKGSAQKTVSKMDEYTIDLCQPVKVSISPKPIKKGI